MTETPKYSLVEKANGIEIRAYPGYIQAEVKIAAQALKTAIVAGFRILAGYIFGNNVSQRQIEMTAPVQVSQSQKIAMTTPVKISGENEFTVAFIMPAEYSLETLPIPTDERITIKAIPAHKMAVIRFRGYFNQRAIEKNKKRLLHWLKEQGVETDGEPIVAGYNPPWVPGFLSRNEVMIKLRLPT